MRCMCSHANNVPNLPRVVSSCKKFAPTYIYIKLHTSSLEKQKTTFMVYFIVHSGLVQEVCDKYIPQLGELVSAKLTKL